MSLGAGGKGGVRMACLGDKELFLLDMDGTIYLDRDLFPWTIPFLEAVKRNGCQYRFLTNNSSKSGEIGRASCRERV